MTDINLTMGFNDYDHVRDLASGRVKAEGITLTHLQMEVEEIFPRFSLNQEWDVSEMSFAMYSSAIAAGDAPFTGIPVFPSRYFRHSSIYVRADGPVSRPEDLGGKRIGVPQWSQTATVYVRGWMTDIVGVALSDATWFQSGVNQAGRRETAPVRVPDGVSLTFVPDRSLQEMLLAGDLDVIFSARPPQAFIDGNPGIARLFPDFRSAEEAYFADTGIYPIMHTVAIKRDVFERHPWVARNMYNAFVEAKRRGVARLRQENASQIAIPWLTAIIGEATARLFPDGDYWPYGIEGNRATIEPFLKYCFDQGVTARHLAPEDLFPKEALTEFKE